MPMINCPECGKEVSDKAKACINCGCPIYTNSLTDERNVRDLAAFDSNYKKSGQKKLLISTVLSLVASIVIIIFFIPIAFDIGTSEIESETDADVKIEMSIVDDDNKLRDVLISDKVVPLEIAVFMISFIISLLSYLNKSNIKLTLAILSAVFNTISSVFIGLLFVSDSLFMCFAPILLIPCILFLVSAFLCIIGSREYFKNVE